MMVLFAADPGPRDWQVAGRIGPRATYSGGRLGVSTRWTPGAPFYQNYVRTMPAGYFANEAFTPAGRASSAPWTPGVDRGTRPIVDYKTYLGMNRGRMYPEFEGRPYLGGFPDDYATGTQVRDYGDVATRRSWMRGDPATTMAYGQPIYREGDEAIYPGKMRLTPDKIMEWQRFFQLNGFKTGLAGAWGPAEMSAMKQFMITANGVPGGGMTVEVLRNRVQAEIDAGRLQPGTLAGAIGSEGGGGGMAGPSEPWTETTTEQQVQQFSTDEMLVILQDLIARQVGRAPTPAELAAAVKQLNARFRADPTVITTVVTNDPTTGQVDTTRTVDESDVDPAGFAIGFAKTGVPQAEREAYQSNRFMDALMAELGMR